MGHETVDQLALLDSQGEHVSAFRNKKVVAERESIGCDTKMREHRCHDCGNIQSFMINQKATCKGKGCNNKSISHWDCLDKDDIKKISLDKVAIAGITLSKDMIPQPNDQGKYVGKFSLLCILFRP